MGSSVTDWLDSLAAKTPTPGGGAVAALAAATAAAQLAMVANYTTGPKFAEHDKQIQQIKERLKTLQAAALDLIQADAKAFAGVGAAYSLPKDAEDDKALREKTIQAALKMAIDPPTQVATLCLDLAEIATKLAEIGNPNVVSDVAVGASMTRAALESATVNIEINLHSIKDEVFKKDFTQIIEDITDTIQDCDVVVETVRERLGAK